MQVKEKTGFPHHFSTFYISLPIGFTAEEGIEPEFSGSCWAAGQEGEQAPSPVGLGLDHGGSAWVEVELVAFTNVISSVHMGHGWICFFIWVQMPFGSVGMGTGALLCGYLGNELRGDQDWKGTTVTCDEALIGNHKRYLIFLIFWFIIIESA